MLGKLTVKKTCYYLTSPLPDNYQIFTAHLERQLQHRAARQPREPPSSKASVPPRGGHKIPSLLGPKHNT